MRSRSAVQALADAAAALTEAQDVNGTLARLVRDCADVLSAQAIGVLVLDGHQQLELLSSTSHQTAELEMFQIQQDSGPCIDAIRTGQVASVLDPDELASRWPQVGAAILAAGFHTVHAFPLRWHGHILGALNVFHAAAQTADADILALGQAFADIASIAIIQTAEDLTLEHIAQRLQRALQARTLIEQAKGVLAYRHGIDMAAAYEQLLSLVAPDSTLTATATEVVNQAYNRYLEDQ
jgi:transcriptional regulator with GAF, ATPase, and Fis domain